MELAKYKNFLSDKELYLQNKKFWGDTIVNLSEVSFEEWVTTKFANGEDFFDGNPIFSAFYSSLNKAVRIIQLPIDRNIALLRVWLDKVNYNDNSIKELVLVVQPIDKAYNSATSLITLFLHGQAIGKSINAYNTFYQKEVSLKSIGIDINKVTSKFTIKPFTELNRLNAKHLQDKSLDINIVREMYKTISAQKRSLKRTSNRNGLQRVDEDIRKEFETIINVLTIENSVDFKNDLDKDTYIALVEEKYGIDKYIHKLHETNSHIDVLSKDLTTRIFKSRS
ncbi:hypothetical protein [Spirosoma areae]